MWSSLLIFPLYRDSFEIKTNKKRNNQPTNQKKKPRKKGKNLKRKNKNKKQTWNKKEKKKWKQKRKKLEREKGKKWKQKRNKSNPAASHPRISKLPQEQWIGVHTGDQVNPLPSLIFRFQSALPVSEVWMTPHHEWLLEHGKSCWSPLT